MSVALRGVTRGPRKVFTTPPTRKAARSPDLLNRDFTAARPNEKWVSDFTYVPTWAGMVYVAFVIDVFSRMIVGWHLATNMRTELIMTALEQAVWRRDTLLDGLVAHSDAGSQYTSIRYTDRLVEIGARPSIGSVADAYDNAMAETTIGLYKTELVEHATAMADCRADRDSDAHVRRVVQQQAPPRRAVLPNASRARTGVWGMRLAPVTT